MARHPKATTAAINAATLLMAFNQEIESVANNVRNGNWQSIPKDLLATGTGISNGHIDSTQAAISVASKVGAYAFNKIAKHFAKFKVM